MEKDWNCFECCHFQQHDIKTEYDFRKAACGHCTFPMLKRRLPSDPACARFQQRTKSFTS